MARAVPQSRVRWRAAYRLIPSRFPPVGPWDRVARPEDFEALAQVEALTNPRIREELGALALIPKERRVAGPGTTPNSRPARSSSTWPMPLRAVRWNRW